MMLKESVDVTKTMAEEMGDEYVQYFVTESLISAFSAKIRNMIKIKKLVKEDSTEYSALLFIAGEQVHLNEAVGYIDEEILMDEIVKRAVSDDM